MKTDSGQQWRVLYGPNSDSSTTASRPGPRISTPATCSSPPAIWTPEKDQIGAAILIDIDAAEVQKAKEGLGKTWAAGKVTANGARIAIQRLDGVAQTIAVDENTEFRHKQDPVTLADVHPGSGIRADGHRRRLHRHHPARLQDQRPRTVARCRFGMAMMA